MPTSFLSNFFSEGKFFRDPIYGFIFVPKELLDTVVHHPLFQRLRWISQMSLAQMVFPSAVHSRFEHSLGTMYLAAIAAEAIRKFVKENENYLHDSGNDNFIEIINDDAKYKQFLTAAMAVGLLHDIGHAPFSHTFEMAINEYDHEKVGFFLTEKVLEGVSEKWAEWTKKVLNKDFNELEPVESLLRSLIDGPIGIDKGDYLLRDSYHCGVNYGWYGHDRLWQNLAVIPTADPAREPIQEKENLKIGVTIKGVHEAYHLIVARFHMYQAIYEHHTKQKIDATITGAIRLTKQIFSFSLEELENEDVIENLTTWTDGYIIHQTLQPYTGTAARRARNIVKNIYSRVLPKPSQHLETIEIRCPQKHFKRVLKKVREEIWKLASFDDDCPFFPYIHVPQSPFPVDKLTSIMVYDPTKKRTISLYEFLKLNITLPLSSASTIEGCDMLDFDNFQNYFYVKAFAYNDSALKEISDKWADLKSISSSGTDIWN